MAKRTAVTAKNQSLEAIRKDVIACQRCTDLACAPLAEPWALRQLLVARRKSSPLSAAMKSFIALCSETYAPSV